ncbi:hypothetical protein [Dactylosporangium sp. NPDC051541]|uniref:hypothetical protein n=1 Tax=Dactylosporangium sp. NPDC051541 TaxID=3363977 RepID=UPI0037B99AC6
MTERETLYIFRIGEAYDDVKPVFVVDGRDYAEDRGVRADVEAAHRALRDLRLIGEVETTSAPPDAPRSPLPTWPQWRARHVDGSEPIGVRPRPAAQPVPAGRDAMFHWLEQSKTWLDTQLATAAAAVAGGRVRRTREPSVHRIGAASVDLAEERFRMDVEYLVVPPADTTANQALAAISGWLRANGWTVAAPEESTSYVTFSATLSGYTCGIAWHHRDHALNLTGTSPVVDATAFDPGGGAGGAAHV